MARLQVNVRSKFLQMQTNLTVILPAELSFEESGVRLPYKVVYLLHGISEDSTSWVRHSRIESYANERGVAVVCPEVQRSFYCDLDWGLPYYSYMTEELPNLVTKMFPISDKREDTFIAGLSMGGYGALKCGLSRPDLFSKIAAFSGAVDLREIIQNMMDGYDDVNYKKELMALSADPGTLKDRDDLFRLAEQVAKTPDSQRPSIYMTCGTEDFLLPSSRRLKDHLKKLHIALTYEEWPGDHNWDFWDPSIKKALDLFLSDPVTK